MCFLNYRYCCTGVVLVWRGCVPLFHIQPGSEYYKRQFCTSKAAGVGPRCIETRSLAPGLGHRWSSQEGRGVDHAFYSSYSHADWRAGGAIAAPLKTPLHSSILRFLFYFLYCTVGINTSTVVSFIFILFSVLYKPGRPGSSEVPCNL